MFHAKTPRFIQEAFPKIQIIELASSVCSYGSGFETTSGTFTHPFFSPGNSNHIGRVYPL